MKYLRLVPYVHRQQPIVKASFAYDRELIAHIKSQKRARWSLFFLSKRSDRNSQFWQSNLIQDWREYNRKSEQ